MDRKNYSSSTPWEEAFAYSRAVRKGNYVSVAGTVASDLAGVAQGQTPYEQATYIFDKIEKALHAVGASMSDVIRTRAFVVNIQANSEGVGLAHKAAFDGINPAFSMIGIAKLIGDEFLVEIEVDAVVG